MGRRIVVAEGGRGRRYGCEVSVILLRRREYVVWLLGTIEDAT